MLRQNGTYRRTCKRYDVPGHAHYLTFSCFRGMPFLGKDRSREWTVGAIAAARRAKGFDLWAYVLMPEHVHLLVLPREGARISEILKCVKQSVARRAVHWVRANRPAFLAVMRDQQPSGRSCYRFWQPGGGYDRNIWTAEELHEKVRYIHANPVRRGIVDHPGA